MDDDDLDQARLDGVRLRDMSASEARGHFERCMALFDQARDDWSRTYVARLARLLYRRLEELGAPPEPAAGGGAGPTERPSRRD